MQLCRNVGIATCVTTNDPIEGSEMRSGRTGLSGCPCVTTNDPIEGSEMALCDLPYNSPRRVTTNDPIECSEMPVVPAKHQHRAECYD